VASALVLAGLVIVLLATGRPDHGTLRLVARNVWMLRHLCRATAKILRSATTVDQVAIDVTRVPHLDASTLAVLEVACRRCTEAGARVVIEGCNGHVAQTILRRGLRVDIRWGRRRPNSLNDVI
jgi:ABC-type transporter Mla MlaB component